jgi:uncharacterized protein YyaL (SSP411 family)
LTNKNILAVFGTEKETCDKFGISLAELKKELSVGREILFKVRRDRPRPHLDDKIITSWNGILYII